jgi:hypothetical protein
LSKKIQQKNPDIPKKTSPIVIRKRKSSKPPEPTKEELARILIKEWVNKRIELLAEVEAIIEDVVKSDPDNITNDEEVRIVVQHPLL